MADLIIQAAEKQAMIEISDSGKYVKYQANMQTLLNMAGLEVELVSGACPPLPLRAALSYVDIMANLLKWDN